MLRPLSFHLWEHPSALSIVVWWVLAFSHKVQKRGLM